MTIKVYDYKNRANNIDIPDDKEISAIFVCVLSGDETGIICFADGTTMGFDALCESFRTHSFYDGCYAVIGQNIQKWIDFNSKCCKGTASYKRQELFDGEERLYYED